MISALIFSKNRALQLDLLLNSIKKNFKQCSEISVLYTTTDKHKKSYEILQKEHGGIKFVEQKDFYNDICDITKNFKNQSVVMFTDDDIVRNPLIKKIEEVFKSISESKSQSPA